MSLLILTIAGLCASIAATGIAAWALLKSARQERAAKDAPTELESRVTDLELDQKRIRASISKWTKQENMQVARDARSQQSALVERARELVTNRPGPAQAELDVDDEKARLRAQFLGPRH